MLRNLAFGIDFKGDAGPISEMSNAVDEVKDSAVESSSAIEGMEDATDGLENSTDSASREIEVNWNKVAIAITGAGVALEAFARNQQDANRAIGRLSSVTGESEEELRNLAISMSDYTFSSKDAVEGMEMLIARGYDTKEQFEAILPVVDTLADATGKDFPDALDTSSRLMNALGLEMEDLADNTDYMTRIINQTDIPLGTLERNLGRVPDELQALKFGLGEASAGIEVFRDRGYTGQESVREFRRAVEESEGDMDNFLDILGLTSEEWEGYQQAVQPAKGLTEEMASINNDNMTMMQRMSAEVENLMFKYGGLADIASVVAPLLVAMGPVVKGLSVVKGVLAGASIKGVVVALGTMIAPIALAVGAIAGIIAIVVSLYNTNEEFRDRVHSIWEGIKSFMSDTFNFISDLAREIWDGWLGDIAGWVSEWVVNVLTWFESLKAPLSALWENIKIIISAALDFIQVIWDLFGDHILDAFTLVWESVKGVVEGALSIITGIMDVFIGVFTGDWEKFTGGISSIWEGAWNIIQNVILAPIGFVKEKIGDLIGWITGIFENFSLLELGKNILTSLGTGFLNVITYPFNLMSGLTDDIGELLSNFSLFDIGKNIVSSLGKGITSLASAPIKAVGNVASGITGRVKGIFGIKSPSREFRGIGRDNMRGLEDGMESRMNNVLKSASSVASGVGNRFKEIFNIQSPSRFFMGIGEDNMKGLEIGMENNEPDIQDLTPDIEASEINARPLNSNQSDSVGRQETIMSPTISITVEGSGEPEEVARKVKDEIERWMKSYEMKLAQRNPAITEF